MTDKFEILDSLKSYTCKPEILDEAIEAIRFKEEVRDKVKDVAYLAEIATKVLERENKTDKEKFAHLFKEVGIKHNVTDDGIEIDAEEVDGATHNLFIKFYPDYNDRYQKIEVYET